MASPSTATRQNGQCFQNLSRWPEIANCIPSMSSWVTHLACSELHYGKLIVSSADGSQTDEKNPRPHDSGSAGDQNGRGSSRWSRSASTRSFAAA